MIHALNCCLFPVIAAVGAFYFMWAELRAAIQRRKPHGLPIGYVDLEETDEDM